MASFSRRGTAIFSVVEDVEASPLLAEYDDNTTVSLRGAAACSGVQDAKRGRTLVVRQLSRAFELSKWLLLMRRLSMLVRTATFRS